MISYITAANPAHFDTAGALFKEYAKSLDISLEFQQFDQELASLPEMYSRPHGGIILAKDQNAFVGCIALRKFSETTGELKRMFVKPAHQQKGIGKSLLAKAIQLAKDCNYQKIRLDTLDHMHSAKRLYAAAGFYEIPPYYPNPVASAIYFEKIL